PEEKDRTELRIETAADDQLVAIKFHHRLHRHTLEVFSASLLGNRLLDRLERGLYRAAIAQVQLHTAHVGFARDGERIQLEYDRVTDLFSRFQRFLLGRGNLRLNGGNVVGLQQLLRLILGENRAP